MAARADSKRAGQMVAEFWRIARFIQDAVILLDFDCSVVSMNPAAEKLTGWPVSELQGEKLDQHLKFYSQSKEKITVLSLNPDELISEKCFPSNSRFISRNEETVYVTGVMIPSQLVFDSIPGVVLIFRENVSVFEYALNGIPDIIGIQDETRTILRYNDAGYRFLNKNPENTNGRKCFDVMGYSTPCEPCATKMCLESGQPECIEKFIATTGDWMDCRAYPILDENDNILYVIEHLRNITKQKLIENKLGLFKKAVDRSSDAISMTTFEGQVYYHNDAFLNLFKDFTNKPITKLFVDEATGHKLLETIKSGQDFSGEVELIGKNNSVLSIFYRGYPIYDNDTLVIGLVNVFTDISGKKEADRKLKESEKLYRNLYETSLACLWRTNRSDGQFLKANLATAHVFGYQTIEEMLDHVKATDFYRDAQERDQLLSQLKKWGEVSRFTVNLVLRDGSEKTLLISAKDYPDHGWIEGVATDITEQKLAEEALTQMEEDLRVTLDSIGDAVIATDDGGYIIRMNPAAERLTGWTYSEARGKQLKNVFSVKIASTEEIIVNPLEFILAENRMGKHSRQLTLVSHGGIERHIDYNGSPIRGKLDKTTGVVIIFRDVTDEYRVREDLRKSEERFRNLAELLPVGVFEADCDLNVTFANTEALKMFQLSSETFTQGLNALDMLSPDSRIKAENNIRRRFGGEAIPVVEYTCRKSDGTTFPVLLYIKPVSNEAGDYIGIRGVGIDITRRKEMEEKLRILSMQDALTNLYNRAFFEEKMLRLSSGDYLPVSIVVCDIDGLKLINETMGHRKGDDLLRATAKVLRRSFDDHHMIARIGGDEFAILLSETPVDTAELLCRKIREETDLFNSESPDLHLSLSVGCATSNEITSDPTELFKIADHNMYRAKLNQSRSSRSDIIQALIKTLEARDYVADGHAYRLQAHVKAIGEKLRLSDMRQRDLKMLCRFHDLGKIGIPDRILLKPGSLTSDEMREVKSHCEIGYRIALTVSDLTPIADFILKHHERWDGLGYPLGLKGEDIPIESRILAIVDSFDAMTHNRPYQNALSKDAAKKVIEEGAGKHFDPSLVKPFLTIIDET